MPLPNEYRGLMRNAILESDSSKEKPLKRRKQRGNIKNLGDDVVESSGYNSTNSATTADDTLDAPDEEPAKKKSKSEIDFVVDIQETPEPKSLEIKEVYDNGDKTNIALNGEFSEGYGLEDDEDDDDDDDDIFEEIDLDNVQVRASNQVGDIVIALDKEAESNIKSKKKGNRNVIDKEEKAFRKNFHKNYLICMMIHGMIRNQWCNDELVHQHLRKLVTTKIDDMLHPPKSVKLPAHRTRRLLDGLRQLMGVWVKYYKVTSNKGLYKHEWYDWGDVKRSPTDFARFKKCLEKGRGSRDISAQGFVSLLRSIDVPSRLCFSLQPPDFTNNRIIAKYNPDESQLKNDNKSIKNKLLSLRKGKNPQVSDRPTQGEIEQKYPVWWAEVWDSAAKNWITIDPVMFQTIEVVKYKSKLEPPLSNKYNNLTYVIGYDRQCGVKDITKRYAEKYFSRTRKKRITKDPKEEEWYNKVIDSLSKRPKSRIDDYEDEFFGKKQEMEGMPDNIQDFKSHPNYVIEPHLRSNEILQTDLQPVGMIRIKGKNEALKVYKRSDVQILRTSRGWYQRGRVLRAGERALKVKQKTANQLMWRMDEDEETEERLYAEYQTDLYIPPPVSEDGLITKNAYGNIDVYVESMIPKGAVHIKTDFCELAAKKLGIDYAKAVVGFKFERRKATPKIEGIIVAQSLADSVAVIEKELEIENREKQEMLFQIRALKGWELMLTKLRIKQRLNKSHGRIADESEKEDEYSGEESDNGFEELQNEYEEYLKNDESESEGYGMDDQHNEDDFELGNGGFIVDHNAGGFVAEPSHNDDNDDYDDTERGGLVSQDQIGDIGGGFVSEDQIEGTGGGFIVDSDIDQLDNGGGFIAEDAEDEGSGGFVHESNSENIVDESVSDESSVKATSIEDEDDNVLDEFEAFMDGLEVGVGDDKDSDSYSDSDEDEEVYEGQEKVDEDKRGDSFKYGSEIPENSTDQELEEEAQNFENFGEEEDLENFNTDSKTKKYSNSPDPEIIEISSDESESNTDVIAMRRSSPVLIKPQLTKEPTFDQDMDDQIKKQLQQEEQTRIEAQDATDAENEDFEFEFDSE